MQEMALAVFDFDGTICPGDSIVPFLLYCVRQGVAPIMQPLMSVRGYLLQKLKPTQVRLAKEQSLSFIQGRSVEEMDRLARAFFRDRLTRRFYPDVISLLRNCRDQGMTIIVVSASASVYMRALSDFLPVDEVLSTPCEIDEQGIYTGRILYNCRDQAKVTALNGWLASKSACLNKAGSLAVGDSSHDVPILQACGKQILVNPDRRLRRAFPCAEVLSC